CAHLRALGISNSWLSSLKCGSFPGRRRSQVLVRDHDAGAQRPVVQFKLVSVTRGRQTVDRRRKMVPMARGKHRKLKNKPGKRVIVAVTAGTGVALPLMVAGSGSASAATQDQWEAIAQCESGNDWAINHSGDGMSVGGLQFQSASWKDALAYLRQQGIDTS